MTRILQLLLLSAFVFGSTATLSAQQAAGSGDDGLEVFNSSSKKDDDKQEVRLDKEFSVGGKITSTGWSFFADYTKFVTTTRKRVLMFEIMELKHPKQVKQSNDITFGGWGLESPKAYVFGKQNNFYAMHFGYGARYRLGDKAKKSGVEVNLTWAAGPSLGITKPYYLNLIEPGDGFVTIVAQKYDPEDPDKFLQRSNIYGASGFSYGLGELGFIPGGFGKVGVNFDWASYSEFIKSLEAGVGADVYARQVPLMIVEQNRLHFVYLYLSLQLGKRW